MQHGQNACQRLQENIPILPILSGTPPRASDYALVEESGINKCPLLKGHILHNPNNLLLLSHLLSEEKMCSEEEPVQN